MKRLSGGLVLLNLTAISLALTSGEVDITDAGILEELTELRQFIDVNRDFSKGFKNLKPILIEYRSSASSFNGITQANLSFNTDALHMSIGANTIQADGKLLVITINVVYEYTDYVGYTIKSAKINAFEQIAGGDASFTGDVSVGGDLEVIGDTSGIKIEDLVDSAGNKRFIEGNVTLESGGSAITKTYGKWSLSGTHLLIVLAGTIPAESVLADGSTIARVDLPSWIVNKIYPTSGIVVTSKKVTFFKTGVPWVNEEKMFSLSKYNNGISIGNPFGAQTITNDSSFRIQFDLLIDVNYE